MNKETSQALFAGLMMSLAQSAMIGLGKVLHPATGKTAVELDAAQQAIDLLEMLQVKTKGNLEADEERALNSTISMLRLNYVETASQQPAAAPAVEPAVAAPGAEASAPVDDSEKVKYRKSYG